MRELYYCPHCNVKFEEHELVVKKISFEEIYGVTDFFDNLNYIMVDCCPNCGNCVSKQKDYEQKDEEEEEE